MARNPRSRGVQATGLRTASKPADHFATQDPPQATAGTRRNPPAKRQQSVPADGTMTLPQPLGWQPFSNLK